MFHDFSCWSVEDDHWVSDKYPLIYLVFFLHQISELEHDIFTKLIGFQTLSNSNLVRNLLE